MIIPYEIPEIYSCYAYLTHVCIQQQALGAGMAAAATNHFKNILQDKPGELDINPAGGWFCLGTTAFHAHALLTDADYAVMLTKSLCAFWLASALQLRFAPASGLKSWG